MAKRRKAARVAKILRNFMAGREIRRSDVVSGKRKRGPLTITFFRLIEAIWSWPCPKEYWC
jgi:hypothetical protein